MELSGNQIRYLLTINKLSETRHVIKSVDVARELDYSRASVHKMLQQLKDTGYIEQEYYSSMKLTTSGKKAARNFEKKYEKIREKLETVMDIPDGYQLGICNLIELM